MIRAAELSSVVDRLKGRRVLVIGDVMLDEYVWGDVSRISPEAPIPVVDVTGESVRPGGAANVLANVCSLTGCGSIIGVVGQDGTAQQLAGLLGEMGVDTSGLVADGGRPTILKRRIVARGQQVVRMDRESRGPLGDEVRARLAATVRERMADCDGVIFSDYGKGVVTEELVGMVLELTAGSGKPVAVDPKTNKLSVYRGVTVVTPNHHEVEACTGVEVSEDHVLEEVGRRMLKDLSSRAVLVTRGEKGMSLIEAESAEHIPTVAKEVYDVTGAGDTVVSALTLGLVAGASMLEAAHLANHSAGIVVGKIGTAPVTRAELIANLASGAGQEPGQRDDGGHES